MLDAEERAAVALLAAASLLAGEAEESEPAAPGSGRTCSFTRRPARGPTAARAEDVPAPRRRRPAVRCPAVPRGPVVELERADLDALARSDPPFAAVVGKALRAALRRRPAGRRRRLGHLLHRAAARRSVFTSEGIELSRRPAPSGGGLAALELYPVVHRCAGLEPGLYHYEADTHRLRRLADVPDEVAGALVDAADPPQVTLLVFLRHTRIAWKYERIAYQLALLDLGVLYQTLWLAATAMGLGGYPLGSVDADRLADAVGLDVLEETGLGAFFLGRPGAGAQ